VDSNQGFAKVAGTMSEIDMLKSALSPPVASSSTFPSNSSTFPSNHSVFPSGSAAFPFAPKEEWVVDAAASLLWAQASCRSRARRYDNVAACEDFYHSLRAELSHYPPSVAGAQGVRRKRVLSHPRVVLYQDRHRVRRLAGGQ
jgi:hypothetical protein